MYVDFLLLSVVAVTAYLVPVVWRRRPPGRRGFGWLLLADGGAALLALLEPPGIDAELIGFIAIAAAVFLLVIPPLLRDLVHRALRADKPRLALHLLQLWELLQPGMLSGEEREMIAIRVAARDGKIDATAGEMRALRDRIPDPHGRVHMDHLIVFLYLSARRWSDAVQAYERRLED